MDDFTQNLLISKIDSVAKAVESGNKKMDKITERLEQGAITFEKHNNRISNVENQVDGIKASQKGVKAWAFKLLTAMGLAGFALWLRDNA